CNPVGLIIKASVTRKWKSKASFRLNDKDRIPSSVSVSQWRNTVKDSAATWVNGTNNCKIAGKPKGLNIAINEGYATDAGITSDHNQCTKKDGYSVIEFGPLSGSTLGLTCSYSTS